MRIETFVDAAAVAARAVDLLAATLRARPAAVLLLPAGATPVPLYAEVVRRVRAGTLDLAEAHLFQLDELVGVAPQDPRGFQAFFREHLIAPLALDARFHALDGSARDPAAEIERHRRALATLGTPDLVLLGLGKNGHVAFNEPGSRRSDGARVVTLGPTTLAGLRAQFTHDPCPTRGITLGLAEIGAGREIAMLVTGAGKADVLARLASGTVTSELPASLLLEHADFRVLADEASSGARR
jgi:glucosamine-6-phosphate deaminase